MSERLDAYVETNRLNRSETRQKILETIIKEVRHFRPPDLLEQLKKRYPKVGKATLYRNLPVLVKSGILQEGPMDLEGQRFYELNEEDHHDHIVCLDCNMIFEFHDPEIERRQEIASRKMKFKPQEHRHVIYASCEYLKKRKS